MFKLSLVSNWQLSRAVSNICMHTGTSINSSQKYQMLLAVGLSRYFALSH